jgi:GTP-binding protein Era
MKSGFAVLIGRSNVGKSTLLNSIVGNKVAITTPKPQTTRKPVQGVLTVGDRQTVFIDTAGIMKKARDPLTKKLHEWTRNSLKDVDAILYVVDATRSIGDEEKQVLRLVENLPIPKLMVINKIDDHRSKKFIDFYRDLYENHNIDSMVEVSATSGSNVDLIKEWVLDKMPEGDMLFPLGMFSNLSQEEQVAEIIREKLFLRLRQEVPYAVNVIVEKSEIREDETWYISAIVEVTDKRYQGMVIGKNGSGIKEIGQSARKELQTISDRKVFLDLHVVVNSHWIDQFQI